MMKMTSRSNNFRYKLFLFVLFVLLATNSGWIFGWLTPYAIVLAKPLWGLSARAESHISELSILTTSKNELWEDYRELKARMATWQILLADRQILINEITHLRTLLGREELLETLVVGRIISNPWSSPYDLIVLDVGRENATTLFKVGDLVTFETSIALGRIAEISSTTSKVKLFSASNQSFAVSIGELAVPAIATGVGGGNIKITLPRGVLVEVGMPVTIPGPNSSLLLGVIGAIDKPANESMQTLVLSSPTNPHQLRLVEIHAS